MTCTGEDNEKYRDHRFSTKRGKNKYKNNWKFGVKLPCSLFNQIDHCKVYQIINTIEIV